MTVSDLWPGFQGDSTVLLFEISYVKKVQDSATVNIKPVI